MSSFSGPNIGENSTYLTLLCEAMPSLGVSTSIFANCPDKTQEIWITVRTAGITLRTDGTDATAGILGHDFTYNTPAPMVLQINKTVALQTRAIQNGGTATGFISYRG